MAEREGFPRPKRLESSDSVAVIESNRPSDRDRRILDSSTTGTARFVRRSEMEKLRGVDKRTPPKMNVEDHQVVHGRPRQKGAVQGKPFRSDIVTKPQEGLDRKVTRRIPHVSPGDRGGVAARTPTAPRPIVRRAPPTTPARQPMDRGRAQTLAEFLNRGIVSRQRPQAPPIQPMQQQRQRLMDLMSFLVRLRFGGQNPFGRRF